MQHGPFLNLRYHYIYIIDLFITFMLQLDYICITLKQHYVEFGAFWCPPQFQRATALS